MRIGILFSFIVVFALHYSAFSYMYDIKKEELPKPEYKKVAIQLASFKLPTEVKKIETKPIIENKIVKKPIKKEAKRTIVKKNQKKKIVKKVVKKKKIYKKIVKEKPKKHVEKKIEKEIEKVVIEEPVKIDYEDLKLTTLPTTKVVSTTKAKPTQQSFHVKKEYKNSLRRLLDRNKKYPRSSKRLQEQGKVIVSFRVLKNGVFENIRLITSSGKQRLDKAALKALNVTGKFKKFPKELNHLAYMDFTLPMKFKLN